VLSASSRQQQQRSSFLLDTENSGACFLFSVPTWELLGLGCVFRGDLYHIYILQKPHSNEPKTTAALQRTAPKHRTSWILWNQDPKEHTFKIVRIYIAQSGGAYSHIIVSMRGWVVSWFFRFVWFERCQRFSPESRATINDRQIFHTQSLPRAIDEKRQVWYRPW